MTRPLIVSTWSFGQRGNAAAWPGLVAGGSSLDAVERASIRVEDDPEVDSVGFGGLPDASGEVTVDGAIMRSPRECGSVCYVREFRHAVSLARRVMENSEHIMLAGAGADAFAHEQEFEPKPLLSDQAREKWAAWRANPVVPEQGRDRGYEPLRPQNRDDTGQLFHHDDEARWKHHDTIGVLALDEAGVLAGACSTSGTPYKTPGRVGDSPIIGHGVYVDPSAGAATATGTGELVMGVCGSFLAVELMRQGRDPLDAASAVLHRILDNHDLSPRDQVALIALRGDGEWAAAALRPGFRVSIRTRDSDEILDPGLVLCPD